MSEQNEVNETSNEVAAAKSGKAPRIIQMEDGRKVDFGLRGLIKTSTEITGNGHDRNIKLTFDVYSGKTYNLELNLDSTLLFELAAYGAKQKVGDSAATTETADDADIAVSRTINQLLAGVWVQRQQASEAKGFTDLFYATLEFKGIPAFEADGVTLTEAAQAWKAKLAAKDDASLKAMRNVPQVRAAIARRVAERAAAKAADSTKPVENDALKDLFG